MRAVLFWLLLAVQHAAVDAQTFRVCDDFLKNQGVGPATMPCPYYFAPDQVGDSSTNWDLKVLRNGHDVGSYLGYTFTNNKADGIHFIAEFVNVGLGLEWRSYFIPGHYYCTTTFPGLMTRYQLSC